MLYEISVAEHGLTGIANIFRSRLSGFDDLLQAGTVPLIIILKRMGDKQLPCGRPVCVLYESEKIERCLSRKVRSTFKKL